MDLLKPPDSTFSNMAIQKVKQQYDRKIQGYIDKQKKELLIKMQQNNKLKQIEGESEEGSLERRKDS